MKLRCINNGPVVNEVGMMNSAPQLKEKEVYTAVSENAGGYELLEVETPENYSGFAKVRFVRVSEKFSKRQKLCQKVSI